VAANSSDIFMQISISASLFADKSAAQDKEVEFAFDSINENIEVSYNLNNVIHSYYTLFIIRTSSKKWFWNWT
jgi:hypothetical protein